MVPDRETALRGIGAIALICLVGGAFVFSYVGALHDPKPHDVPVAVAGPGSLVEQVEAGGSFAAKPVGDAGAAAREIDERQAYASVVAGATGEVAVTTAPAAGIAIAEVIEEELVPALRKGGARVRVDQVHPLDPEDARGLAGFYLAVGLTVAGYLGATFLGLIFTTRPSLHRTEWRLEAIAVLSVFMGLVGAAIVHLLGALDGSFLAAAGVGALTVFGVGAATVALQSAFGLIGTGFAILLFVVLGNPSSTGPVPAEMLPGFWRAIGPFIPIGACVDLFRNISYFPAAGNLGAIVVLAVWAIAGATAALLLGSRSQRYRRAEQQIEAATSS